MATATACEIVCDGLDLLKKYGWRQAALGSTSTGFCLWGCVQEAARRKPGLAGAERDLVAELAVIHIVDAIRATQPKRARRLGRELAPNYDSMSVIAFNDTHGRTADEILKVMEVAGTCQTPQ